MSETLPIQHGWGPPPKVDRSPKTLRRKYPVADMKIGDVLFIPGRTARSVSAYISRITKGMPGTFVSRNTHARQTGTNKAGDPMWKPCDASHPDAVEGSGVWRME